MVIRANTDQKIEIESKDLDHLGIVSGIVDDIGIVEEINKLLGTDEQEIISSGVVVKALILNCLGFLTAPLYLFSQFFVGKPTEQLLGKGIKAEHLNDTRIGRVLDKIYNFGLTKLFLTIALKAAKKFGILSKSSHLDSTSIHVHGQYIENDNSNQEESKESKPIHITKGYSKDHRPDLKQFLIFEVQVF
jgi:transposase